MGQTQKGTDLDHSRVLYSRDVLFNESTYGIENSTHQGEIQSVIISTPSEGDAVTDAVAEPVLRRSERDKRTPDYYGDRVSLAYSKSLEPLSLQEALASADKEKGMSAMEREMKSLYENDVWSYLRIERQ